MQKFYWLFSLPGTLFRSTMGSVVLPLRCQIFPKLFCRVSMYQMHGLRTFYQSILPIASVNCSSLLHWQQQNMFSTSIVHPNIFSKLKERIVPIKLQYKRRVLHHSGLRLYICCTDLIDYDLFFTEFKLVDTFSSWFRVVELHAWLVMVRLASEGPEGTHVRNGFAASMWKDVDRRSRKLGSGMSSSARRESIQQLAEEFRAALFSYDEGMLSDDRVLAGALWRTFFQQHIIQPEQLELMVNYVRKQQRHLYGQQAVDILSQGTITFLPLHGDELDEKKTQDILKDIVTKT